MSNQPPGPHRIALHFGKLSWLLSLAVLIVACLFVSNMEAQDRTKREPGFQARSGNSPRRDRDAYSGKRERKDEERDRHRERSREHEEEEEEEEEEDPEHGNPPPTNASYVVLAYNDLGMHCMNQDFSQLCILPPFNNLHAQVIRRGREPRIVTQGVDVNYWIPNNTSSANKTNFWLYAYPLFGAPLPPNVGLTGKSLAGSMTPTGNNDWSATGIPITPIDDNNLLNPYPLAEVEVQVQSQTVAQTKAVVPVSWEISCNLCHAPGQPGPMVDADILRRHDIKHQTNLMANRPVLCASCHADPALGTPGAPQVSTLSRAMHHSHANRMQPVAALGNTCYACHPGFKTNCQRDIHFAKGIFCTDCHGSMTDVGAAHRTPWRDQPSCGSCHKKMRPEFDFEEPGKLFKDSHGHGNVHCSACHGSPHAIGPAVTPQDNVQAILHQGFAGTISKCTVCHTQTPNERFEHKLDD